MQIAGFHGECTSSERERSYSLEQEPLLKHSRRRREEHKRSSCHPHQGLHELPSTQLSILPATIT